MINIGEPKNGVEEKKSPRITQQPTMLLTQFHLGRFMTKSTNERGRLTFLGTHIC